MRLFYVPVKVVFVVESLAFQMSRLSRSALSYNEYQYIVNDGVGEILLFTQKKLEVGLTYQSIGVYKFLDEEVLDIRGFTVKPVDVSLQKGDKKPLKLFGEVKFSE